MNFIPIAKPMMSQTEKPAAMAAANTILFTGPTPVSGDIDAESRNLAPVPIYKQASLSNITPMQRLPVVEQMVELLLSLPVQPQFSTVELEFIVSEVNNL